MKKLFSKIGNAPYSMVASLTVAMWSLDAKADANNVGGIADTISNQLGSVGKLATGGAFVVGLGLAVSGLLRLKKASDTQGQQVPYTDGMWRIGVGGALMALPALTGVTTASLGLGDTGVSVTRGGGSSF